METQFSISGIVVPAAWDREGVITAVLISTFNDTDYLVHADENSRPLLGYARQAVWASVELLPGSDEPQLIRVLEFRPLRNTDLEE
ncbi:MAG: hypothetical protein HY788_14395 [Deltaproteobacteria bacterium]|nr:hypothetical protein [Deltaproteobacteria bacterium]